MPPAAPCNQVSDGGATVTCTGNLSTGVLLNNGAGPVTTLDVQAPTPNITPASGVDGIHFTSGGGDVTLNSNLGALEIVTTGGGIGIFAATTGAVRVTSVGNITTSGDFGDGILAGSNNANPVSISSTGNITTTGDNAYGIGAGAINGAIAITSVGNITTFGAGARGISAGSIDAAITISSTGNITTTGASASGISATNVSGAIRISSSGNITGTGAGSNGIFASSIISDLSVTITSGSVTGGSGSGVGVRFSSGSENLLTNYGTISALSGLAVSGDIGDETVNNYGTITGNVNLGGGANAFNNMANGLFAPGSTVILGAGNMLTNAGTISPGGSGTVLTTILTGNIVQTATGKYATDVDLAGGTHDLISVTGSANLAGTVVVEVDSLKSGPQGPFPILTASGVVTNSGLGLAASPAFNAALSFDSHDVFLTTALNFAVTGLNQNQTAISQNLKSSFLAGSGGLSPVLLGLANTLGLPAYKNALDQLSPEIYNYALIETLYGSQQFSNDLLSCRVAGEDGAAFIREGQCIWARARPRFLELDHTANDIGLQDTTGSFSAGAQFAFAPDWRLGFAAGYDKISLDTSTDASSDGDRANIGAVVKYNPGPLLLAAGVTGGWGFYDTTRNMSFGGFNAVATSNSEVDYVSGQLHAAYLLNQGTWYLKPLVDAAVTEIDLHSFTESGGGGAALIVPSSSDTVFSVSPALEIGTEIRFNKVAVWRPFLRAGVTWQDTSSFALDAGFLDAPQGIGPFTINTKLDQVLADVSTGLDVINASGIVMRLQYDGRFAQETQQNSVSLKGSVPF